MTLLNLIADTKDAIADYERAKKGLANVLLGADYIVQCEGVYLTFDVDHAGNVSNPRHCQPHRARSFTRKNAEMLAGVVSNGNGNGHAGAAIHIRDAVDQALDAQRAVLETLIAFQDGQEQEKNEEVALTC